MIKPPRRPQIKRADVERILEAKGVVGPAIVGIRGYYLDSMGKARANDRGIYDDCIAVVGGSVFKTFNANTDPSVSRRGIATLRPGVHLYRKGKHGISRPGGGYPALRPATVGERLPVDRDGVPQPRPGIAINIHKGSRHSTSSEGCQTIYPDQWPEFIATVYALMDRIGATRIPYVLVTEEERRSFK